MWESACMCVFSFVMLTMHGRRWRIGLFRWRHITSYKCDVSKKNPRARVCLCVWVGKLAWKKKYAIHGPLYVFLFFFPFFGRKHFERTKENRESQTCVCAHKYGSNKHLHVHGMYELHCFSGETESNWMFRFYWRDHHTLSMFCRLLRWSAKCYSFFLQIYTLIWGWSTHANKQRERERAICSHL